MKKRIAIVEDNALNLKLFRDLLEANNYEVYATQDGQEGYELIKRSRPDLIIMDIQLHHMSGFDIISDIKQDPELVTIPIIAVTAFAMKDDEERILNSGCNGYVSKPISIIPFLNTIKKFLGETQTVI